MGKGDKKTKRGKIIIGSYGVRRAKKRKTFKAKPGIPGGVLPGKQTEIIEPVARTVIEEQPVAAIQEPVAEIPVVEEHPVKKTPKKSTPKKTAEKTEETAEPKPKVAKTKKKTAGPGEEKSATKEKHTEK